MQTVIATTIVASLTDSLNPVAIAQQIVLQSSTKRKHDILAYILGIGMTNFVFGLIIYFGLSDIILNIISYIEINYPSPFPILAILAGVILIFYIFYSKFIKKEKETEQQELRSADKTNLSVWTLFGIGVVSCAMELTSALPYLAYLTFLIQLELSAPTAILFLIVYNILFNVPLYLLYAFSLYYDKYLLRVYSSFQRLISFLIRYVVPIIVVGLGIFLIIWGINTF